jgi:hypothetical protein
VSRPFAAVASSIAGLAIAIPAHAVPVDGTLDPDYGPAASTQTMQSSLGDFPVDFFTGSELDGAYGFVEDDTLHLVLTGSFNRYFTEPLVLPTQLQLYIDVQPGGQGALSASNPVVGANVRLLDMTGMRFDVGFEPDYWLTGERESAGPTPFAAYYAELPTGGGGSGYYLGSSAMGGPGTLSGPGANNPFGILASIDISNTGGVTAGCGPGSGAGVTTGIEWAVPLAALGNPTGPIRICALLAKLDGGGAVSNQILGPVPPGTCALGLASGVDLSSVPGPQYFEIGATTPTERTSWGRLKSLYR